MLNLKLFEAYGGIRGDVLNMYEHFLCIGNGLSIMMSSFNPIKTFMYGCNDIKGWPHFSIILTIIVVGSGRGLV